MKLQLVVSGGIAGFTNKFPVLNVDKLSDQDKHKLKELIISSNFYNLPVDISDKGADLIYTTLIIENDNKQRHSVRATFLNMTPTVSKFKELTKYVNALYKKY